MLEINADLRHPYITFTVKLSISWCDELSWTKLHVTIFVMPTIRTLKAFGPRYTEDRGENETYSLFLYHFHGPHYRVVYFTNSYPVDDRTGDRSMGAVTLPLPHSGEMDFTVIVLFNYVKFFQ